MAKVKCSKCFFINPDGQEHCIQCRSPLPKIRIESTGDAPQSAAQDGAAIQLQRGQVVARRYTVVNLIGRGGMGCIYKVHDNVLSEDVALKTLLPQFVRDKIVVERFFNEARIARRLAHPNIVRVHDIGSAEGFVYISMEYLQGHSLRGILEKLPPGQRLPILETLRLLDQLCAALEYAHQFTIHRDIKPENVMVEEQTGAVKLMDFGISKLMANNQLTGASMVMGTPYYMSPEQLKNSRDVDARADIFSVGVMLYEILTGNMPTGVPRPASQVGEGVPPALDAILARCVDPNPEKRYASVSELRAALRVVRDTLSGDTMKQPQARVRPQGNGWSLQSIAGVALVVLLLLGTGVGLYALELRRNREMLENGAGNAAGATAAPSQDLAGLLAFLDTVPERVRPHTDEMQALFDTGKELLVQARDAADPEQGIKLARSALQYMLAPKMARDGMAFVQPGPVEVGGTTYEVPAFFIDKLEVSVREYRDLAAERFPAALLDYAANFGDNPMSWVTNYDAKAYAARLNKVLPTAAQWCRAAYGNRGPGERSEITLKAAAQPEAVGATEEDESPAVPGCMDMAGNVAEWTRTTQAELADGRKSEVDSESNTEPLFGTQMAVMGGDFENPSVPLDQSRFYPYESAPRNVGFRCVVEIPDTQAGAEAVLRSLS